MFFLNSHYRQLADIHNCVYFRCKYNVNSNHLKTLKNNNLNSFKTLFIRIQTFTIVYKRL